MKKILTLTLCLALLLALLAACGGENDETTAPNATGTPTETERVTVPISFRGLQSATYTEADMIAAMGGAPDFVYEQQGSDLHVYNDVGLDGLTFSQVQFSFDEGSNRISCTYSVGGDLQAAFQDYQSAMTGLYGEPSLSEQTQYPIYTWYDGQTENYVMLTYINEMTVQLVYYFNEAA